MDRRHFLFAAAAAGIASVSAATNPDTEVYALFAALASSLSEGNASAFMKPFDKQMEGYATLRNNIGALMAQDVISTSVDVQSNEGDEQHRTAEVNWYINIISQQPLGPSVRRQEKVICKLERRKKKWIITSLQPLSFFAPPR